jgi:DNA-binding response OmpR family regulator
LTTRHGLILLLTNQEDNWAYSALESAHEVVTASDFQQAVKMLNNIRCDLLILDDAALGAQTANAISELKRYFPNFPIAILAEGIDEAYYEVLVAAGADLLLSTLQSTEELQQQIRLVLHQNVQRRALEMRNQKLYIISSLPLMLRNLSDTQEILFQAIKVSINLLDLQAVNVVINDGYGYRAFTGNKPLLNVDQLTEMPVGSEQNNPILWSIEHRMTQVYSDVYLNPRFSLPPGIDSHSAAIIVPFAYPGGDYGAVAFYVPSKMPIVNEDISIYERFVAQIDSILLRAHQNQMQGRQLSLQKRLVDGWGTFANAHSFDEIIRHLASIVGDTNAVRNVLIACRDPQTMDETLVDDNKGKLVNIFSDPVAHELLEDLQLTFGNSPQTRVIDIQEIGHAETERLLRQLGSERIILMPIAVSGEKLGIMLISVKDNYHVDALDLHLLENITQIAVNALQRTTLRNIVLRNHLELMSIVCSITEGVFYVDERQKVSFYNPQLTELTSIPVVDWTNQDVDSLLRAIAMTSQSPVQTLNQFQNAMQQLTSNTSEREYPIVTVSLAERNAELSMEFVRIDNDNQEPSWLGIIHPVERSQGSMMLERLLERARVSNTQLHSAINSLAEQHGHFSYNERSELLEQISADAANAGKRWTQFADLYRLYMGGLILRRETVNLNDLLERIFRDPRLSHASAQFKTRLPSRTGVIKVDEFHFGRALADLFARLLEVTPREAQIEVKVETHTRDLNIIVSSTSPLRPFAEMEEILANSSYQSTGNVETLDLYIAAELIRRNGAQIAVQSVGNDTSVLLIVVPVIPTMTQGLSKTDSAELSEMMLPSGEVQNSAPSREPNSIMIVQGKSKLVRKLNNQLKHEGFSILEYDNGEDAVMDVTGTYLDLIVIDLHLEDENGFDVCKQIRKKIETPILLIADNATAQERVQGLQVGADDFITAPVSDEELMARVRVIVNRRYIAARTSEPILFGDLYVDFARRAVFYQNQPIELTRIEYDILYTLIVNRGQTVTHKQLLTQVWGPEYQDESQYLWVNISRLRKKLEPTQDSPRYIRTQSGVGYYFSVA